MTDNIIQNNASYKGLIVWQKSMDMVVQLYSLLKFLPREEDYALSAQMRRAAVSIPSNIAEGKSRISDKEYARFLSIARGSVSELETQICICERLHYFSSNQTQTLHELLDEIGKMLSAIIAKYKPPNS